MDDELELGLHTGLSFGLGRATGDGSVRSDVVKRGGRNALVGSSLSAVEEGIRE